MYYIIIQHIFNNGCQATALAKIALLKIRSRLRPGLVVELMSTLVNILAMAGFRREA
jgi:hypothetical protein